MADLGSISWSALPTPKTHNFGPVGNHRTLYFLPYSFISSCISPVNIFFKACHLFLSNHHFFFIRNTRVIKSILGLRGTNDTEVRQGFFSAGCCKMLGLRNRTPKAMPFEYWHVAKITPERRTQRPVRLSPHPSPAPRGSQPSGGDGAVTGSSGGTVVGYLEGLQGGSFSAET